MNQLTIAIIWLACINFASSTCCTSAATLHFKIRGGVCGVVGAKSNGTGCKITICPNGEALVGSYCGKAACDVFGCQCIRGCLQGSFAKDFLQKNYLHGIELLGTERTELCFLCQYIPKKIEFEIN
ncbi:protein Diedel [Drosophila mauritiana]|uniref:Protein Diedel n=1 Tax=Drosophila mauritiana TaxID=7226 RepID=A0A6P8KFG0_DROMA|nr:protein Diedel [Drosophila mauritiana]